MNILPSSIFTFQLQRGEMNVRNQSKNFSIIDNDLTVEGNLSCRGKLIVKGTVRGNLDGETVIVAKEGAVYATTRVASMTVAGTFVGNIVASKELIILSTGNCSGKIVCKDLSVEAKGQLNAEVSSIALREVDSKDAMTREKKG